MGTLLIKLVVAIFPLITLIAVASRPSPRRPRQGRRRELQTRKAMLSALALGVLLR